MNDDIDLRVGGMGMIVSIVWTWGRFHVETHGRASLHASRASCVRFIYFWRLFCRKTNHIPGLIHTWHLLYPRMIVIQRIKIILHPFRRIINYVFFDALIFLFIPNDTVVIIGLKKMILSVVFWNIQTMFIDIIINFGIHGRFKTGDEWRNGFWFAGEWWMRDVVDTYGRTGGCT